MSTETLVAIVGAVAFTAGLFFGIGVGTKITLKLLKTCESAAQSLYWSMKQEQDDNDDESEAWKRA